PTWIAIGAVAVAVLGTAVWMERRATVPGFYRAVDGGPAAQPAAATPSAIAAMGAAGSVDDALLRAAPASDAERWLVAAERQLRAGRLTAPPGDNAYTSLLNAWQADSGHLRVGPAIDALIEALAARAERDVASGEPAAARTAVMQANQLASRTARADGPALRALGERMGRAVAAEVGRAAARFDRAAALDALESARGMGLAESVLARLDARARAI